MSAYQYYEFRAIDRPLSEQQRRMLRSLSTRAQITATSFVNTYDWGDFRGDADELMETCFDAFVYVSNCGLRRFSVRLPAKFFNTAISASKPAVQGFGARSNGKFVVLDFLGDDQGADEAEGEGWMDALVPLRADLLRGDQRSLYLGWLCTLQLGDIDEEEPEPPVPPGLQSLSESLKAFVDFLNIDTDLLEAAASDSTPEDPPPARTEIAAWIRAWPESEKDALLIAAAMDEGMPTGAEILRRYDLALLQKSAALEAPSRRTAGELLAEARKLNAQKEKLAAEREAAMRARELRQAAETREQHLDQLSRNENLAWQRIETAIQTKQQKQYDVAVSLLVDLRDLSVRSRKEADFHATLAKLRDTHERKPALLERLCKSGLLP